MATTAASGRRRVVIVGDVVTSRRFVDPDGLVAGLRRILELVNERVMAARGLALHLGDEFAGTYDTLGAAAAAVLRLRLATDDLVLPTVDDIDEAVELRLGVGIGEVVDRDGHLGGHGWYLANDAREQAQSLPTRHSWPTSLRSRCLADDAGTQALVNAHLLLQDQLLARLDARDRRALTGLLDGERQVDIAQELGITQPAIARRLRDRGALALHRALQELVDVPLA